MGKKVTVDYRKAVDFIGDHELQSMKGIAQAAGKVLVDKSGQGND